MTEYSQMLEQAEPIERQLVYQKMREALVAFSRFMNTLDGAVGREAYRELFPEIDYWLGNSSSLGEVQGLLNGHCDCCGLRLASYDLIGREQYVIGQFQQACSSCTGHLLLSHPETSRPLARLQSFARQHLDRLATTIIAALNRRNWDFDDLKNALQIDTLQVLQLSMSRSLEQHDIEGGIAAIAAALPCDRAVLHKLLVDEGKS